MKEALTAISLAIAGMGVNAAVAEEAHAEGRYIATCHEAIPGCEVEYTDLLGRLTNFEQASDEYKAMLVRLEAVRRVKWVQPIDNLVTTVGKNFALDSYLAGSAYTAAWFMGLISLVSYSAVAVGDTQASHAGWLEAGATNAPTFSGARKTAAWAAASAGSKALSAGLVFTFTGAGTVKGCFLTTGSAVDGTTGTLYSAGLFSGGDQPVVSTNTLTVTYTASL